MKINIWLDDLRPAPDGWLWAKTADECNKFLMKNAGNVGILSLDHDLGDDERYGTGFSVCKYLIAYDHLFPREIYLHTANPIGRDNMYGLLVSYINLFQIPAKLNRGPEIYSWEESVRKSKELGYF